MAEGGGNVGSKLTNRQRVRLGAAISSRNMESIALGYLDLDPDTMTSLKEAHRDNTEAFNRTVIEKWANRNPGNQVKTLALLLYEAARDCSYVDANKVQDILGVSLAEGGFPTKVPAVKPSAAVAPTPKSTAVVAPGTRIDFSPRIDVSPVFNYNNGHPAVSSPVPSPTCNPAPDQAPNPTSANPVKSYNIHIHHHLAGNGGKVQPSSSYLGNSVHVHYDIGAWRKSKPPNVD